MLQRNDQEMPKLLTLSHEFLRSFCRNNKENQNRLHKYVSIDNDAKEGLLKVETVIPLLRLFLQSMSLHVRRDIEAFFV
jgi:hypothetical protein